MGADDERLAGEAAVEDRLLRGPDAVALRLPHPRGRHPQRGGPAQSKKQKSGVNSSTRLGHLLLGLVLVQADGGSEHNFHYICTNVVCFELFDGRNNYFECIADER